jgi:hypothetical protein
MCIPRYEQVFACYAEALALQQRAIDPWIEVMGEYGGANKTEIKTAGGS